MSSITKILGKARHVITGSMAVLLLSGAMLTNASAADTVPPMITHVLSVTDQGVKCNQKGGAAEWQQLIDQKSHRSVDSISEKWHATCWRTL